MFATTTITTKNHTRTQLQQALDRDSVGSQPRAVGLDDAGRFGQERDPTAPIFRRADARAKTFQFALHGGRAYPPPRSADRNPTPPRRPWRRGGVRVSGPGRGAGVTSWGRTSSSTGSRP